MQMNHNSMVKLVDRRQKLGFVRRTRSREDRRQVTFEITLLGNTVLPRQPHLSGQELRIIGSSVPCTG
jgi:DNA-binding MarR family transcriptional regulator